MGNGSYVPKRAMVIVAHPDDIEFGCAGTVARWVEEGAEVCYVLVTSGDVGIARADITRAEAGALRETEQSAAAAVVGVQDVVYLREPDGHVVNTLDLRKRLVREIRRFKPEVVICSDPTVFFVDNSYINHPDHRAVAAAALDAVFPAAGQPHVFEELAAEGLAAHKVRKVYVEGWGGGDTWINISGVIDRKVAALRKHVSQMGEWDPEPMLRQWSRDAGKGKEMEYAETFRVMNIVSDEDWAKLHPEEFPPTSPPTSPPAQPA
jgi:LmbE family N-acetylglucosaminyl deacetylase